MLPTSLISTIVLEVVALLTMGVVLITLSTKHQSVPVVVGIILTVISVLLASFLVFPSALRHLVAKTRICEM